MNVLCIHMYSHVLYVKSQWIATTYSNMLETSFYSILRQQWNIVELILMMNCVKDFILRRLHHY